MLPCSWYTLVSSFLYVYSVLLQEEGALEEGALPLLPLLLLHKQLLPDRALLLRHKLPAEEDQVRRQHTEGRVCGIHRVPNALALHARA